MLDCDYRLDLVVEDQVIIIDKARAIRDEDHMTGRLNFSRVCKKCGLENCLNVW